MRPWLSIVLLTAAVAVAVALIADVPVGATGTFHVQIIGPDGVVFDGNVSARDATAYDVLLAASQVGGFDVQATGSGGTLFVTAIADTENDGAAGWCYEVRDDGWTRPAIGADAYGLERDQASRWIYEQDGCGALG